jgi:RND family efflux transporter MFP subunit
LLNSVSTDDPMAVDVAVDQAEIPKFTSFFLKGTNPKDSIFTAVLPDGSVYPHPGQVYLIDRSVDPTTGTIKVRITFSNPQNELKAGLTTNIRVKHDAGDSSILIPFKSATEQLGEYYVFVADSGHAYQRKVALGTRIGGMIVVRSGLKPGEKIVTDGVQKLRDSSAIQVGPPKGAGGAATK